MPRRGIFGNLSKMSRRQFLCRGQPPERLELNFRCPRIVTVLMRRPPHLAPTLVICFPSEHRSTAHGKTRKSGVRRHHVRACFGASMPEPLLPKPAKMPRMRDSAFISNEMCPHARTRLTFLVLKRTRLITLFFAFQVITSTCLEICSPLCAPRSHVTCIPTGRTVVCPCLSMRGSGEALVVTAVISSRSRPSPTQRSYVPLKVSSRPCIAAHGSQDVLRGRRRPEVRRDSTFFAMLYLKCRKRLF